LAIWQKFPKKKKHVSCYFHTVNFLWTSSLSLLNHKEAKNILNVGYQLCAKLLKLFLPKL
jgi:hypothetical protein